MVSSDRRSIIAFVPAFGLLLGAAAAWHYASLGLTLSHYDARGHLTVARRVLDNLTPGWRQLGALWLPLPHVLNLLPVLSLWNYQTGMSAVVINLLAMAAGLGALARLVFRRTDSVTAALTSVAVVGASPSVVYLQSTPMTEPLLFGLSWLALDAADRTLDVPELAATRPHVGLWLALATLTRYEAWPISAALVLLTALARPRAERLRTFARLALGPAAAAVTFLAIGRITLGQFSDTSFFVPDNPAAGRLVETLREIYRGLIELAGAPVVIAAALGVAIVGRQAWRERTWRPLLPLALFAAAALPFALFYSGHPFRVRYMVPLIAAAGALAGALVAAVPRRARAVVAVSLVGLSLWARPAFRADDPMVIEAQREIPVRLARAPVSAVLAARHDHEPILASMGSLGHYIQEMSRAGFVVRDFLNEGNGDLWSAAVRAPRRHVGWIVFDETAEARDQLAVLARTDSHFLDGFTRVASGGGAVLYRRDDLAGH